MTMKAKDSALVAGASASVDDGTTKVKAVSGFMHDGKAVAVGAVITVPARLARELIAMNKAVVIASPQPAPEDDAEDVPPEDDDDQSAAPRRGRPPKSKE